MLALAAAAQGRAPGRGRGRATARGRAMATEGHRRRWSARRSAACRRNDRQAVVSVFLGECKAARARAASGSQWSKFDPVCGMALVPLGGGAARGGGGKVQAGRLQRRIVSSDTAPCCPGARLRLARACGADRAASRRSRGTKPPKRPIRRRMTSYSKDQQSGIRNRSQAAERSRLASHSWTLCTHWHVLCSPW